MPNSEIKDINSPKNKRRKRKRNKKLKANKDDGGDDEEFSQLELQRMLQTLFPSKAGKEKLDKLEAFEKLKTNKDENKNKSKKKKRKKNNEKSKIESKTTKDEKTTKEKRKRFSKISKMEIANVMNECDIDYNDAIDLIAEYKGNLKKLLKENAKESEEENEFNEEEWEEEDEEEEEDDDDSDEYMVEEEDETDTDDNEEEVADEDTQNINFKIVFTPEEGDENAVIDQQPEQADGGFGYKLDFGSIISNSLAKMYNEDYGLDGGEGDYDEEYKQNSSDEDWIAAVDSVEKQLNSSKKKNTKNKSNKPEFDVNDNVMVELPDWDKAYEGTITKILIKKEKTKVKGKKKQKIKKSFVYDIKLLPEQGEEEGEEFVIQEKIEEKYISPIVESKVIKAIKNKYLDKFNDLKAELSELEELIELTKKKTSSTSKKRLEKFLKKKKTLETKLTSIKKRHDLQEKAKQFVEFRNLLKEETNMNHLKYFKNMEIVSQKNIVKRLAEINKYGEIDKPYIISLVESEIDVKYKSIALKKLNSLNYMDPSTGEYYKLKLWVDTFMRLPLNINHELPINIDDGIEKCNEFMDDAKNVLDSVVYGLEDAKMQIMQMLGQWITNPSSIGTAVAIKGPMGTGKTTLVKEGISKILKRPFSFIALGGATDSSFLEGHSYTYEGSSWGKIVDTLIHSKCMNPVFYFDELDKVSDTPKGEEIIGILTHLTDTTQNSEFHDKYFSNINFNLSRAMFIFSYNDETKINTILKDRMYHIETKGYSTTDKYIIAQKYLIPVIEKSVKFESGNIVIPDETIKYICENYTENEKGVRNLKRALEIIFRKINLYRLMKKDSPIFEKEKALKIEFPFKVTEEIVKKLIKIKKGTTVPFGMYL